MFPILLRVGPISLHTYGVLIALGCLAGLQYAHARLKEMRLSEDDFWKLAYLVLGSGFLGGKLAYVLLQGNYASFGEFLANLRYGFIFFGGLLTALAATAVYARRRGWDYLAKADFVFPATPLRHAFGRLGCFAAGGCYGSPTRTFLGVRFTRPDCLVPDGLLGVPLHPAQLYEAAGNLAIFALLHFIILPRRVEGRLRPGAAFTAYLVLYAALRFVVELFRGDDRGAPLGPFSVSQTASLAVLAGVAVVMASRSRSHAA